VRPRVTATPFRLPLRAPVTTAHGVLRERLGSLVCAEAPGGVRGWGECAPLPGFAHPFHVASAARETALLDLRARRSGVSLAELLAREAGTRARRQVPVSALLAGDTPEAAAEAARDAVREGFRTLKLKVGALPLERDAARVAAVRRAAGAATALRADANGALDEDAALRLARALAEHGVELLEQPVPAHRLDALLRVRAASPVPIAADEAASTESGARLVMELGAADILVLKPAFLGPRATLRVARRARECGVGVLVTSALDGAVGRTTALHVAAALPAPLPACGLATGALLADDHAALPEPKDGLLAAPDAPGLGFEPEPAALARLRVDLRGDERA